MDSFDLLKNRKQNTRYFQVVLLLIGISSLSFIIDKFQGLPYGLAIGSVIGLFILNRE